MVDTQAEVCHTQQVEMLASSVLVATQQAVNASVERFKQAVAYHLLHPHLVQQSLCHIGDDEAIGDVREALHCQLQAGRHPLSPDLSDQGSPHVLNTLLAHFNNTLIGNHHDEPFFQDGGDADDYCE